MRCFGMNHVVFNHLSDQERLDLIAELWASLDHDALPLSDAQVVELDRRLERAEADRAASVPWTQMRQDLLQRR